VSENEIERSVHRRGRGDCGRLNCVVLRPVCVGLRPTLKATNPLNRSLVNLMSARRKAGSVRLRHRRQSVTPNLPRRLPPLRRGFLSPHRTTKLTLKVPFTGVGEFTCAFGPNPSWRLQTFQGLYCLFQKVRRVLQIVDRIARGAPFLSRLGA
jgi:hypothetical protein